MKLSRAPEEVKLRMSDWGAAGLTEVRCRRVTGRFSFMLRAYIYVTCDMKSCIASLGNFTSHTSHNVTCTYISLIFNRSRVAMLPVLQAVRRRLRKPVAHGASTLKQGRPHTNKRNTSNVLWACTVL